MHPPQPQPTEDHTPYYRQILHGLIDMANDMARQIHAEATRHHNHRTEAATAALPPTPGPAATPTADTTDPTLRFDRIARAIRRTVALARKLDEPPATPAPAKDPAFHRTATRTRILREVEDTIQHIAHPAEIDTLNHELRERLDDPDLDDDIDTRPVADIVADICRDMGVAVPYPEKWKRRTPAEAAQLAAQARITAGTHPRRPAPDLPHPHPKPAPRSDFRPNRERDPLDIRKILNDYAVLHPEPG